MATLRRAKSGNWLSRKGIPAAVRETYGKWEEKKTWPASLTAGQAKAEHAAWLEAIESRIETLRASIGGSPVHLTKRQCKALAGEWYQEKAASEEEAFTESSGIWDWDADLWAMLPEEDDDSLELQRLRPIPPIVMERDQLLQSRGLRLDDSSADRLLQEMLKLYPDFLQLMQRSVELRHHRPWLCKRSPFVAPRLRHPNAIGGT